LAGGPFFLRTLELDSGLRRSDDFVIRSGRNLVCFALKSGRRKKRLPGISAFTEAHKPKRQLLVGQEGISLEEFLLSPVERWLA
jgi:hypothetical protein